MPRARVRRSRLWRTPLPANATRLNANRELLDPAAAELDPHMRLEGTFNMRPVKESKVVGVEPPGAIWRPHDGNKVANVTGAPSVVQRTDQLVLSLGQPTLMVVKSIGSVMNRQFHPISTGAVHDHN